MEMVVIYGAITLHENYTGSTEFIKSLGDDLMFPSVSASDFGLGDYNNYHYEDTLMYDYSWDNMVISYANTTGAAIFEVNHLELFILKMEHILRNIDFASAIVHIQSVESSENADLFWQKKRNRFRTQEEMEEEHLLETEEWYFGYGKRSLAGYLNEPVEGIWHSLKDHPYPATFSERFTQLFFNSVGTLIQNHQTDGISRAELEKEVLPDRSELRKMIGYLLFKKVIKVESDGNIEIVKVIRPELMNVKNLYR